VVCANNAVRTFLSYVQTLQPRFAHWSAAHSQEEKKLQMGAPPLSQGVLAQALYEENFNGCPVTLQILGACRQPQYSLTGPLAACMGGLISTAQ
jgi:hypothetical protein